MIKIKNFLLLTLIVIQWDGHQVTGADISWDDHDITTLKLLQIVHRHGERTVLEDNMPKTDPFRNRTYWLDGFGQLTPKGKYRMYKVGENLRKWYNHYLGSQHSPREVYARSSIEHRCLESVSALLSGMYPPENRWQWGENNDPALSAIWQPFPIETFMPKDEDTLLVPHKKCPKVDDEHKRISDSPEVRKIVEDFHRNPNYSFLKNLFADPIDSIYRGQQFWDTLKIEQEFSKTWDEFNTTYTQEMAIKDLEPLGIGSYVWDWNRDFIRKIRLGRLAETLTQNMENAIEGKEREKRVYVYSTHDSIVVPLLQALDLQSYNNMTPAYGAAILIELHQLADGNHSVQVFYYNDTLKREPYPYLKQTLEEFRRHNQKWFYTDFDKECGIKSGPNLLLSEMTFLVIGIAIGIGLIGLNIAAVQYIRSRKNRLEISR